MAVSAPSNDLIWLCVRNQSAYIVKRPSEKTFSRDPLNLTNRHTAKYSGVNNARAVGVQPSKSGKGVTVITHAKGSDVSPKKQFTTTTLRSSSAKQVSQNLYKATVARGYRVDLRYEILARGSAVVKSQQQKADKPAPKQRGVRA